MDNQLYNSYFKLLRHDYKSLKNLYKIIKSNQNNHIITQKGGATINFQQIPRNEIYNKFLDTKDKEGITTFFDKLIRSVKTDSILPFLDKYKNRLGLLIGESNKLLSMFEQLNTGSNPQLDKVSKLLPEVSSKYTRALGRSERGSELYDAKNPEKSNLLIQTDSSLPNFDTINSMDKFNKNFAQLFSTFTDDTKSVGTREDLLKRLDQKIQELEKILDKIRQFELEHALFGKKLMKSIISPSDISKLKVKTLEEPLKNSDYLEIYGNPNIDKEKELNLYDVYRSHLMFKDILNGLNLKYHFDKINDPSWGITAQELMDMDDIETKIRVQTGGIEVGHDKFLSGSEINSKLIVINESIQKIYDKIDKINTQNKEYVQLYVRYNYFVTYLSLIIRRYSLTDELKLYKYVDKQVVSHYLKLIADIMNSFTLDKLKKTDKLSQLNKFLLYLNKVHYITLKRVNDFLTKVMSVLDKSPPNTVILISEQTDDNIAFDFIIFNHFKEILNEFRKLDAEVEPLPFMQ